MARHKHADLIIAWANGAKIQAQQKIDGSWDDFRDDETPRWIRDCKYRIKPEPKPDIVAYTYLEQWIGNFHSCNYRLDIRQEQRAMSNIKLTYCGETGNLKAAEVLK